MPSIEMRRAEPTADRIVLLIVYYGLFILKVPVNDSTLPALNRSHEQKSMKQPPTTQIIEFPWKPSV